MEPMCPSPMSQLTHLNQTVSNHAKVAARTPAKHSKAIIAESFSSLPVMTGAAFVNEGQPPQGT